MAISVLGVTHRDALTIEPGNPATYDYSTFTYGAYGTYKPGNTTSGLPAGVTQNDLTVVGDGTKVIYITAGGVYDKMWFKGKVVVKTTKAAVRFTRCWFSGNDTGFLPTGASGLVDCANNAGTNYNVSVYDSVFAPTTPCIYWNGMLGHDYIAERCQVYNTTDGFNVGNTLSGTNANVALRGNYVHNLSYFSPDALTPTRERDHTHNDCVQWFGGANLEMTGNHFDGHVNPSLGAAQFDAAHRNPVIGGGPGNPFAVASDAYGYNFNYPRYTSNSSIQITQGVAPASGWDCDSNWFAGGGYSINIGGTTNFTNLGSCTNNRFIRTFQYNAICSPAPNQQITVKCTFTNNVYDDTGTPVSIFVGP